MNELEKFLKNVEEQLQGIDEKIKKKLDSWDAAINEKLKARGFGWNADADENPSDSSCADSNNPPHGETVDSDNFSRENRGAEYAETSHSTGANTDDDSRYNDAAKKIEDIAPYMDDRTLHNMVWEFLYGDLEMNMVGILPFLSDSDISLLTQMLLKSEGETFKGLRVKDILPFAKEADLNEIFIKRAKAGYLDRDMMPFVGDKCWHEIVKDYCKAEDSTLNIDEIYPYLDDDDITLLFKTYLKRQKKHKKK